MTMIILETCGLWDIDYNSDNWELEFMTIFVTWKLRMILDSIRNSCDVYNDPLFIKIGYFGNFSIPRCARLADMCILDISRLGFFLHWFGRWQKLDHNLHWGLSLQLAVVASHSRAMQSLWNNTREITNNKSGKWHCSKSEINFHWSLS